MGHRSSVQCVDIEMMAPACNPRYHGYTLLVSPTIIEWSNGMIHSFSHVFFSELISLNIWLFRFPTDSVACYLAVWSVRCLYEPYTSCPWPAFRTLSHRIIPTQGNHSLLKTIKFPSQVYRMISLYLHFHNNIFIYEYICKNVSHRLHTGIRNHSCNNNK